MDSKIDILYFAGTQLEHTGLMFYVRLRYCSIYCLKKFAKFLNAYSILCLICERGLWGGRATERPLTSSRSC
jgi:hypothetical protein